MYISRCIQEKYRAIARSREYQVWRESGGSPPFMPPAHLQGGLLHARREIKSMRGGSRITEDECRVEIVQSTISRVKLGMVRELNTDMEVPEVDHPDDEENMEEDETPGDRNTREVSVEV